MSSLEDVVSHIEKLLLLINSSIEHIDELYLPDKIVEDLTNLIFDNITSSSPQIGQVISMCFDPTLLTSSSLLSYLLNSYEDSGLNPKNARIKSLKIIDMFATKFPEHFSIEIISQILNTITKSFRLDVVTAVKTACIDPIITLLDLCRLVGADPLDPKLELKKLAKDIWSQIVEQKGKSTFKATLFGAQFRLLGELLSFSASLLPKDEKPRLLTAMVETILSQTKTNSPKWSLIQGALVGLREAMTFDWLSNLDIYTRARLLNALTSFLDLSRQSSLIPAKATCSLISANAEALAPFLFVAPWEDKKKGISTPFFAAHIYQQLNFLIAHRNKDLSLLAFQGASAFLGSIAPFFLNPPNDSIPPPVRFKFFAQISEQIWATISQSNAKEKDSLESGGQTQTQTTIKGESGNQKPYSPSTANPTLYSLAISTFGQLYAPLKAYAYERPADSQSNLTPKLFIERTNGFIQFAEQLFHSDVTWETVQFLPQFIGAFSLIMRSSDVIEESYISSLELLIQTIVCNIPNLPFKILPLVVKSLVDIILVAQKWETVAFRIVNTLFYRSVLWIPGVPPGFVEIDNFDEEAEEEEEEENFNEEEEEEDGQPQSSTPASTTNDQPKYQQTTSDRQPFWPSFLTFFNHFFSKETWLSVAISQNSRDYNTNGTENSILIGQTLTDSTESLESEIDSIRISLYGSFSSALLFTLRRLKSNFTRIHLQDSIDDFDSPSLQDNHNHTAGPSLLEENLESIENALDRMKSRILGVSTPRPTKNYPTWTTAKSSLKNHHSNVTGITPSLNITIQPLAILAAENPRDVPIIDRLVAFICSYFKSVMTPHFTAILSDWISFASRKMMQNPDFPAFYRLYATCVQLFSATLTASGVDSREKLLNGDVSDPQTGANLKLIASPIHSLVENLISQLPNISDDSLLTSSLDICFSCPWQLMTPQIFSASFEAMLFSSQSFLQTWLFNKAFDSFEIWLSKAPFKDIKEVAESIVPNLLTILDGTLSQNTEQLSNVLQDSAIRVASQGRTKRLFAKLVKNRKYSSLPKSMQRLDFGSPNSSRSPNRQSLISPAKWSRAKTESKTGFGKSLSPVSFAHQGPTAVLQLRASRILGTLSQLAVPKAPKEIAFPLASSRVLKIEFPLAKFESNIGNTNQSQSLETQNSFYFDPILDSVTRLLSSAHRPTRLAAVELFHALVLFIIGKQFSTSFGPDEEKYHKLWSFVAPHVFILAQDSDEMVKNLFNPLGFQLVHLAFLKPKLIPTLLEPITANLGKEKLWSYAAQLFAEFFICASQEHLEQTSQHINFVEVASLAGINHPTDNSTSGKRKDKITKNLDLWAQECFKLVHSNGIFILGIVSSLNLIYKSFRQNQQVSMIWTTNVLSWLVDASKSTQQLDLESSTRNDNGDLLTNSNSPPHHKNNTKILLQAITEAFQHYVKIGINVIDILKNQANHQLESINQLVQRKAKLSFDPSEASYFTLVEQISKDSRDKSVSNPQLLRNMTFTQRSYFVWDSLIDKIWTCTFSSFYRPLRVHSSAILTIFLQITYGKPSNYLSVKSRTDKRFLLDLISDGVLDSNRMDPTQPFSPTLIKHFSRLISNATLVLELLFPDISLITKSTRKNYQGAVKSLSKVFSKTLGIWKLLQIFFLSFLDCLKGIQTNMTPNFTSGLTQALLTDVFRLLYRLSRIDAITSQWRDQKGKYLYRMIPIGKENPLFPAENGGVSSLSQFLRHFLLFPHRMWRQISSNTLVLMEKLIPLLQTQRKVLHFDQESSYSVINHFTQNPTDVHSSIAFAHNMVLCPQLLQESPQELLNFAIENAISNPPASPQILIAKNLFKLAINLLQEPSIIWIELMNTEISQKTLTPLLSDSISKGGAGGNSSRLNLPEEDDFEIQAEESSSDEEEEEIEIEFEPEPEPSSSSLQKSAIKKSVFTIVKGRLIWSIFKMEITNFLISRVTSQDVKGKNIFMPMETPANWPFALEILQTCLGWCKDHPKDENSLSFTNNILSCLNSFTLFKDFADPNFKLMLPILQLLLHLAAYPILKADKEIIKNEAYMRISVFTNEFSVTPSISNFVIKECFQHLYLYILQKESLSFDMKVVALLPYLLASTKSRDSDSGVKVSKLLTQRYFLSFLPFQTGTLFSSRSKYNTMCRFVKELCKAFVITNSFELLDILIPVFASGRKILQDPNFSTVAHHRMIKRALDSVLAVSDQKTLTAFYLLVFANHLDPLLSTKSSVGSNVGARFHAIVRTVLVPIINQFPSSTTFDSISNADSDVSFRFNQSLKIIFSRLFNFKKALGSTIPNKYDLEMLAKWHSIVHLQCGIHHLVSALFSWLSRSGTDSINSFFDFCSKNKSMPPQTKTSKTPHTGLLRWRVYAVFFRRKLMKGSGKSPEIGIKAPTAFQSYLGRASRTQTGGIPLLGGNGNDQEEEFLEPDIVSAYGASLFLALIYTTLLGPPPGSSEDPSNTSASEMTKALFKGGAKGNISENTFKLLAPAFPALLPKSECLPILGTFPQLSSGHLVVKNKDALLDDDYEDPTTLSYATGSSLSDLLSDSPITDTDNSVKKHTTTLTLELDYYNSSFLMRHLQKVLGEIVSSNHTITPFEHFLEAFKFSPAPNTQSAQDYSPHFLGNVKQFLFKILLNNEGFLTNQLRMAWLNPLIEFVYNASQNGGNGINYLVRDICRLLLYWGEKYNIRPDPFTLDSDRIGNFFRFLFCHSFHIDTRVRRSNITMIRSFLSMWTPPNSNTGGVINLPIKIPHDVIFLHLVPSTSRFTLQFIADAPDELQQQQQKKHIETVLLTGLHLLSTVVEFGYQIWPDKVKMPDNVGNENSDWTSTSINTAIITALKFGPEFSFRLYRDSNINNFFIEQCANQTIGRNSLLNILLGLPITKKTSSVVNRSLGRVLGLELARIMKNLPPTITLFALIKDDYFARSLFTMLEKYYKMCGKGNRLAYFTDFIASLSRCYPPIIEHKMIFSPLMERLLDSRTISKEKITIIRVLYWRTKHDPGFNQSLVRDLADKWKSLLTFHNEDLQIITLTLMSELSSLFKERTYDLIRGIYEIFVSHPNPFARQEFYTMCTRLPVPPPVIAKGLVDSSLYVRNLVLSFYSKRFHSWSFEDVFSRLYSPALSSWDGWLSATCSVLVNMAGGLLVLDDSDSGLEPGGGGSSQSQPIAQNFTKIFPRGTFASASKLQNAHYRQVSLSMGSSLRSTLRGRGFSSLSKSRRGLLSSIGPFADVSSLFASTLSGIKISKAQKSRFKQASFNSASSSSQAMGNLGHLRREQDMNSQYVQTLTNDPMLGAPNAGDDLSLAPQMIDSSQDQDSLAIFADSNLLVQTRFENLSLGQTQDRHIAYYKNIHKKQSQFRKDRILSRGRIARESRTYRTGYYPDLSQLSFQDLFAPIQSLLTTPEICQRVFIQLVKQIYIQYFSSQGSKKTRAAQLLKVNHQISLILNSSFSLPYISSILSLFLCIPRLNITSPVLLARCSSFSNVVSILCLEDQILREEETESSPATISKSLTNIFSGSASGYNNPLFSQDSAAAAEISQTGSGSGSGASFSFFQDGKSSNLTSIRQHQPSLQSEFDSFSFFCESRDNYAKHLKKVVQSSLSNYQNPNITVDFGDNSGSFDISGSGSDDSFLGKSPDRIAPDISFTKSARKKRKRDSIRVDTDSTRRRRKFHDDSENDDDDDDSSMTESTTRWDTLRMMYISQTGNIFSSNSSNGIDRDVYDGITKYKIHQPPMFRYALECESTGLYEWALDKYLKLIDIGKSSDTIHRGIISCAWNLGQWHTLNSFIKTDSITTSSSSIFDPISLLKSKHHLDLYLSSLAIEPSLTTEDDIELLKKVAVDPPTFQAAYCSLLNLKSRSLLGDTLTPADRSRSIFHVSKMYQHTLYSWNRFDKLDINSKNDCIGQLFSSVSAESSILGSNVSTNVPPWPAIPVQTFALVTQKLWNSKFLLSNIDSLLCSWYSNAILAAKQKNYQMAGHFLNESKKMILLHKTQTTDLLGFTGGTVRVRDFPKELDLVKIFVHIEYLSAITLHAFFFDNSLKQVKDSILPQLFTFFLHDSTGQLLLQESSSEPVIVPLDAGVSMGTYSTSGDPGKVITPKIVLVKVITLLASLLLNKFTTSSKSDLNLQLEKFLPVFSLFSHHWKQVPKTKTEKSKSKSKSKETILPRIDSFCSLLVSIIRGCSASSGRIRTAFDPNLDSLVLYIVDFYLTFSDIPLETCSLNIDDASILVNGILQAISLQIPRSSSVAPMLFPTLNRFPSLMEGSSISNSLQYINVEFFKPWIPQLLAYISTPCGPVCLEILLRLAKICPSTIWFPWNTSRNDWNAQSTSLAHPLSLVLHSPRHMAFVDALNDLTEPKHRLSDQMNALVMVHKKRHDLQEVIKLRKIGRGGKKSTKRDRTKPSKISLQLYLADLPSDATKSQINVKIKEFEAKICQMFDQIENTILNSLREGIGPINSHFPNFTPPPATSSLKKRFNHYFKKNEILELEHSLLDERWKKIQKEILEHYSFRPSKHLNDYSTNLKQTLVNPTRFFDGAISRSGRQTEQQGSTTPETILPICVQTVEKGEITLLDVDNSISVMSSLRKPKKVTFHATNLSKYSFLVKGGEDLRLDQRIQDVFGFMNSIFASDEACSKRNIYIRTYSVIPCSDRVGILEWVNNCSTLKGMINSSWDESCEKKYPRKKPASPFERNSISRKEYGKIGRADDPRAFFKYHEDMHNSIFSKLNKVASNSSKSTKKSKISKSSRGKEQATLLLEKELKKSVSQFAKCEDPIPAPLLRDAFVNMSGGPGMHPQGFFLLRQRFMRSLGTFSVVCWILGIGDRHLDNFMIDMSSGEVVPIDFGHSFGTATTELRIPELVPFRLTRQLTSVFDPLGKFGIAEIMTHVLGCLSSNSSLLLKFLQVFIEEPLLEWTKFAERKVDQLVGIGAGTSGSSGSSSGSGSGFSTGSSLSSFGLKSMTPESGISLSISSNSLDGTSSSNDSLTRWVPRKKLEQCRKKLLGVNPVEIFTELLNENAQINSKVRQVLILFAQGFSHNLRKKSPRLLGSTEDQVNCLLDMATDPQLLGRLWHGWMPWI